MGVDVQQTKTRRLRDERRARKRNVPKSIQRLIKRVKQKNADYYQIISYAERFVTNAVAPRLPTRLRGYRSHTFFVERNKTSAGSGFPPPSWGRWFA
jgi:hypothetical protein